MILNQLKNILFACFFLCSLSAIAQKGKPEPYSTETEGRQVFQVAEEMPRFSGCEDLEGEENEKKNCAQEKMMTYIYDNLEYPEEALENETTGTVVVRFIVEPDGSLTNFELVRDIGDGCGEAAISVLETMPNWIPGKQKGNEVPVHFNLPVKFKL